MVRETQVTVFQLIGFGPEAYRGEADVSYTFMPRRWVDDIAPTAIVPEDWTDTPLRGPSRYLPCWWTELSPC